MAHSFYSLLVDSYGASRRRLPDGSDIGGAEFVIGCELNLCPFNSAGDQRSSGRDDVC